jgi:hypothetical protein
MKKIFLIVALNFVVLSCKKENEKSSFTIGQDYQGGKIAYIDATGLHGLIAAPLDQSSSIFWHYYNSVITSANGTGMGTGNSNTSTIITFYGSENNAARICYDLELGGYSDWFLPSKDELNLLYLNRASIGNFANESYWSSTEKNSFFSWQQHFGDGTQISFDKSNTYHVRAVRLF